MYLIIIFLKSYFTAAGLHRLIVRRERKMNFPNVDLISTFAWLVRVSTGKMYTSLIILLKESKYLHLTLEPRGFIISVDLSS